MKTIKYLIPLWIGVLLYTSLSIFFGPKGLSAYSQLESELARELANVESLKELNADLSSARGALIEDRNSFHIYARELGYAAPDEHFVRIIGLGSPQKLQKSPGQTISPITPHAVPDLVLRIFSFFMAFTLFISMGAYDFLKIVKEKEAKAAGYRYRAV